jgi:uncharacterized integral membrane protein
MFILILIILIVLIVTIFPIQNAAPVTGSFLLWQFDASLAIVVFLSVLSGMIVMLLLSLSIRLKGSLKKNKNQQ